MNFDFSEDLKFFRNQVARFLADRNATASARKALDDNAGFDRELWRETTGLGWAGIAIPEEFGGSDLGYQGLCILAEELGRTLAPLPFSSSVYLAAEALRHFGTDSQKRAWLPGLADGSLIGTLALVEGIGNPDPDGVNMTLRAGKLNGTKCAVSDGGIADMAIVVARLEDGTIGLVVVNLHQPGVIRTAGNTIDPTRNHADLTFSNAAGETLETGGWHTVLHLLARAAILVAFEQIGGAQACLAMAQQHALDRQAFGRPIGSFQAIKHKLARVFIDMELARSNAYFGAWAALGTSADEVVKAAATARLSAGEAFEHAARENIQTHGGMGFTWESDCHLYYRRARLLALGLGSASFWSRLLMDRIGGPVTTKEAPDGL